MSVLEILFCIILGIVLLLVALSPFLAVVVHELRREEELRRNSTGGRNYVE